jgi:hypothetical protein
MARHLRSRILEPELESGPEGATFDDGIAVMEVVDALKESAGRGGELVDLPATTGR